MQRHHLLPVLTSKSTTTRASGISSLQRIGGILVLGVLLTWFTGCATAPVSATTPAATPTKAVVPNPNPMDAVKKGMTTAEVRTLLGEPKEIKPFKEGDVRSEVWVYQFLLSEEVRPVTLTTREVPLTNPLTGQTNIVQEPVMGHEFIKVSEITELLMVDGRLIAWKRKPQVDRTIN